MTYKPAGITPIISVSANRTITAKELGSLVVVSASGGNVTITLPPLAQSVNRSLTVVKSDSSTNQVIVDGNGAETVGGAATQSLTTQNANTTITATSTGWVLAEEAEAPLGASSSPLAQCRLDYTSATTITLSRFNGCDIWIDAANYTIPSSGITASNTGLTPNTTYQVYVLQTSGTLSLEFSTTAFAVGTKGMPIKTGDSTRTLVGRVRTNGSTPCQFVDTATQRFVSSYFNRTGRSVFAALPSGVNVTSTTPTELSTSARVEFLVWANAATVFVSRGGKASSDTVGKYVYAYFGRGTTLGTIALNSVGDFGQAVAANSAMNLSKVSNITFSDGYNWGTLTGASDNPTAPAASVTANFQATYCDISFQIQG